MQRVFLGLVGGLVVYEIVTLRNKCDGDTISEIVWAATAKRPIVPFAAGVLCGHFFWQRAEERPAESRGIDYGTLRNPGSARPLNLD